MQAACVPARQQGLLDGCFSKEPNTLRLALGLGEIARRRRCCYCRAAACEGCSRAQIGCRWYRHCPPAHRLPFVQPSPSDMERPARAKETPDGLFYEHRELASTSHVRLRRSINGHGDRPRWLSARHGLGRAAPHPVAAAPAARPRFPAAAQEGVVPRTLREMPRGVRRQTRVSQRVCPRIHTACVHAHVSASSH